ncbi:hypothetical protein DFH09DRAFT_1172139, partial [Mycena vulgaris]
GAVDGRRWEVGRLPAPFLFNSAIGLSRSRFAFVADRCVHSALFCGSFFFWAALFWVTSAVVSRPDACRASRSCSPVAIRLCSARGVRCAPHVLTGVLVLIPVLWFCVTATAFFAPGVC